jgi:signal transduction histidine kinase
VLPCEEGKRVVIKLTNLSQHDYTEQDLALFFDPLWQKDASRTSADRYGLGLAIVKSYCENISADLNVAISAEKEITFTITI